MNLKPSSLARSLTLAALSSLPIAALAQEEPDYTFSGLLDVYYQYDFGRPFTGNSVNFRQFDTYHNGFVIAAVQGTVVKRTKANNPFGFTLQLSAGRVADVLALTEPAGSDSSFKFIQQGFVTYAGRGYTVDLGKFLTWIGYEGIITPDQDNYSRSFLFYFAQPVYHVGLRATTTVGRATVGAYLVNGWNEVEDSNAGKSYGISTSLPVGRGTLSVNYYGGNEGAGRTNGFGAGGNTNVQLGDFYFVYPASSRLKLALNGDYGSADGLDSGDPSGKFYGLAGYLKYTLDDAGKTAVALRYDTFQDPDGFRSGVRTRYTSVTGTFDYNVSPTSLLRAEVRYDKSNRNVFNKSDGGFADDRTTLLLSHVLRF